MGIVSFFLCLSVTSHSKGKKPGFHHLSFIAFTACSIPDYRYTSFSIVSFYHHGKERIEPTIYGWRNLPLFYRFWSFFLYLIRSSIFCPTIQEWVFFITFLNELDSLSHSLFHPVTFPYLKPLHLSVWWFPGWVVKIYGFRLLHSGIVAGIRHWSIPWNISAPHPITCLPPLIDLSQNVIEMESCGV